VFGWFWDLLKGRGRREDGPKPSAGGEPQLMLDTGGHMALITGIAFTPDGRQLISASHDKTIRVWDVVTGRTVRTIRGESAPGPAGKISAMALSPDGKWLAAGGDIGDRAKGIAFIRLYDFVSGRLAALLKGHENVVVGLAFSPDGQHLISGSCDFTAILWDVKTRRLEHRLTGHGDDIYAVGFTPDSQHAVTGSFDHDLRLWRVADGGQVARMTGHGDKVQSLAVAPDGAIVSGDWSGEIRMWDPGSMSGTGSRSSSRTGGAMTIPSKVLARQEAAVRSLGVSPDGKRLLSGAHVRPPLLCHVYDLASGREIVTYSGHDNIVAATAICPDGRWAATGGGNAREIHLWDLKTGERRMGPDGQPLTLGGQGRPVWAAGFSADGTRIGWGDTSRYQAEKNNLDPLLHELALPSVADALPRPRPIAAQETGRFRRAVAQWGAWFLEHRKGGNHGDHDAILDIKQGGTVIGSIERGPTNGYGHNSYSFTPDGEAIISGGRNGVLTAYDRQGNRLGDFTGHEGDVWAVAPSPDGRYLVSGAADQTLRLWNLKTRELLVTLFHGAAGEWVMWTPEGYFTGPENAGKLIGWQINYGPEFAAEYVTGEQLARRLYQPQLIARTIELASAKEALAESDVPANIIHLLSHSRPPQFRVLQPTSGASLKRSPAALVVKLAPSSDPLSDLRITVNSRQVAARDSGKAFGSSSDLKRAYNVPLQQGWNKIRVVVVNAAGETPEELTVHFSGRGALDERGKLYLIAVGVDRYDHYQEARLNFAASDARAFAEAMKRYSGPLHNDVITRLLITGAGDDDEPTAENIVNALRLFRKARANDTLALFLAGHGTSQPTDDLFRLPNFISHARPSTDYLFLPQDAQVDKDGWVPRSVVKWPDLQGPLHNAEGLRLLFVDTCHAHGAYDPRLLQQASAGQIVVFAATDSGEPAYEPDDLGHGVFTFALTQGLAGRAAHDDEGNIGLGALQQYVHDQVVGLSDGAQTPMFRNTGGRNFVIARRLGA
jgi:WD40 repeat protein